MKWFHFPNVFIGNSNKQTNIYIKKLIVFEIAKANNEMMSNVLSNILEWPGGNTSKQVRLIPMHALRHDSVTLAQPTQARCEIHSTLTFLLELSLIHI